MMRSGVVMSTGLRTMRLSERGSFIHACNCARLGLGLAVVGTKPVALWKFLKSDRMMSCVVVLTMRSEKSVSLQVIDQVRLSISDRSTPREMLSDDSGARFGLPLVQDVIKPWKDENSSSTLLRPQVSGAFNCARVGTMKASPLVARSASQSVGTYTMPNLSTTALCPVLKLSSRTAALSSRLLNIGNANSANHESLERLCV